MDPSNSRHWLIDILAGGVIGAVVGAIVAWNIAIFLGVPDGYEAELARSSLTAQWLVSYGLLFSSTGRLLVSSSPEGNAAREGPCAAITRSRPADAPSDSCLGQDAFRA